VKKEDMRKTFRFEFQNEPGIDAGGVAREWFQLTSEQLFNPDVALFSYSAINQMCMQINPMSGFCNEEHLRYFQFCGRLLGKALFDRQIVNAHLVQNLYKHILGWPVVTKDLESLDIDVHQVRKQQIVAIPCGYSHPRPHVRVAIVSCFTSQPFMRLANL